MDGLIDDFSDEDFTIEELTNNSNTDNNDDNDEELDLEELDEQDESQKDIKEDSEDEINKDSESTEEEDSDEDKSTDNKEEVDDNSISSLVDFLTEQGVIDEDLEVEIDDSPEGLVELFKIKLQRDWDERHNSLSKDAQRLIEIELNGGDIKEAFSSVFNDIDYNKLDLTDEDIRRNLLTDYYKEKYPKLNEERLSKKLTTLFDVGDDEEEAVEAKEYFLEKQESDKQSLVEESKRLKEEEEELYEKEYEEYNSIISKSESLAGIPFKSVKQKEEFKDYLFKVGKDGKTQAQRDDADKETVLTKEWYKFNKFNFDKVKKQVKTELSASFKKITTRHKDKNAEASSKQVNTRKDNSNTFSLGELY